MTIKKLFSKSNLKPDFKFRQNGNIWRLFFNNSNFIAGETRDINSKQAYIFSYNIVEKKEYLKNFRFDENWWFAIDTMTDNTIIVSNFQKPEMPVHQGFKVLDLKTGNIIWKNDDLEYFFADNKSVFAVKHLFESRVIYRLNHDDGSIMEEYKGDGILTAELLKNENDLKMYEGLINTEIMDLNDPLLLNRYSPVLSNLGNLKIEGEIEYIEFDKYLILNHHTVNGIDLKNIERKLLTNTLEIYTLENAGMEFTDILNRETSSYVPDSFFVHNGYLFYIREKSELICIKLNN